MVYIWFHLGHTFRAFVGLTLYNKIPRSHQMAANISIPPEEGRGLQFAEIMQYMKRGAEDALKDFTSSTNRWLAWYLGSTVLCLILDLINFFTQVKDFGDFFTVYADLALIIISSIFLFIDWYYILWGMSLMYKFPFYVGATFIQMFFGFIQNVHERFGNYLRGQSQKFQSDKENQK